MSLLGFSPASANTILTYTGNDFTSVTGSYTTSDMVTGTIDSATALGDNFVPGAISVVSYSFSDGLQTLTNTNSNIALNVFETNATGVIVGWEFQIGTPAGPNFIDLSNIAPYSFVGDATEDSTLYSVTSNTDPGTWKTSVAATPLPAALPLFATGLGSLGLFGWRKKRKNAAAIAAA